MLKFIKLTACRASCFVSFILLLLSLFLTFLVCNVQLPTSTTVQLGRLYQGSRQFMTQLCDTWHHRQLQDQREIASLRAQLEGLQAAYRPAEEEGDSSATQSASVRPRHTRRRHD